MAEKEEAIQEKEEAIWDRAEAIRVNAITQDNLAKATEQVVSLSVEKEKLNEMEATLKDSNTELSNKISMLENNLTSFCQSSAEKEAEIAQLSNVIRVIESDKAVNFESGLALAQWHKKNFPDWEQINWSKFKVPGNVESPIPPYFYQFGQIKDLVLGSYPKAKKKSEQA